MRLKLLTVTNEMKVELTELNKYEGKLKQPNGPKANEGAIMSNEGSESRMIKASSGRAHFITLNSMKLNEK